jgi:gamma-glutamyltranspeptidase / glutathione hydrolase
MESTTSFRIGFTRHCHTPHSHIMPIKRVLASTLIAISLAASLAPAQPDRVNGRAFATRSPVLGQHGMVCTSQPLASQIGIDVLKAGGSAVDAAIAANAALGLMEPTGNGVGGDLFAIVWDAKTKKLYGLNASGRSPLGLSFEQMKAELAKTKTPAHIPPRGFLPISVPGAVDGWAELHKKFGKRPLADDLAPTIRYAEEGFPVTQYIAYGWAIGVRNAQADKFPGAFLAVYAPTGKAPAEGEIFKNPALARTLTLIARAAASCAKSISKNTRPPGSIPCRSTTAATMFTNCRRIRRASPRCKS